ncbi:GNAT family N-acetyltransferase [Bacillus ndiopicus]|uniref:GNAT family N-acetyltransferase n=1 Tax=Bacillus ndiopicus TaxID=1347368 RepID=UPI0005AAE9A7|nr:GNAT family N-acetyltransferase [Bacillus ndiopicus]
MTLVKMIKLNEQSLVSEGCYCLRSDKGAIGYQDKSEWMRQQFQQGLQYIKLMEGEKQAGFIEYTPIEQSSRVVYGENYMMIHCLWVGITGKGYASKLIQACIEDAKAQNKNGVVVVTNAGTSWTPSKDIFIKWGFEQIDCALDDFELLVYAFNKQPKPYFPSNWEERVQHVQELTIFQTAQCPFIDVAKDNVLLAAEKLNVKAQIIPLTSREQLLQQSPTPYGVYAVVFKGQLIAFHRLTVHSAMKRLKVCLS